MNDQEDKEFDTHYYQLRMHLDSGGYFTVACTRFTLLFRHLAESVSRYGTSYIEVARDQHRALNDSEQVFFLLWAKEYGSLFRCWPDDQLLDYGNFAEDSPEYDFFDLAHAPESIHERLRCIREQYESELTRKRGWELG